MGVSVSAGVRGVLRRTRWILDGGALSLCAAEVLAAKSAAALAPPAAANRGASRRKAAAIRPSRAEF